PPPPPPPRHPRLLPTAPRRQPQMWITDTLDTGLIDVNLGDMQKRISEETHHALTELSTNAGYPITETLSGSGDLGQVLVDAIKKYDMDLVVCGHHQDFWSKLMSSARQLINTVHVDMLIVPLRDE
ncbi:universal stress protein UspA, partial [Salmonella enterica]|uniref:universal stress protein UspA n=1 Tax=Salmonella enterica TaxID=28901 RepID=UPI001FD99406